MQPMAQANIIDGKAVAQRVRDEVKAEVDAFLAQHGEPPGLATVLVGDDPASEVYVAGKRRACEEVGIRSIARQLPGSANEQELLELIDELNSDDHVNGFIVQLPLPGQIEVANVLRAIDPAKDVDGLTPTNAGLLVQGRAGLVPATPSGVMELLREAGVGLEGAEAVVVGRSDLVGKPLASLLLAGNATVTVCHSRTRDLAAACRHADVLIAAVGKPALITGDMVKPGAIVIDVGTNRTEQGLVGDVAFESAVEVAGTITPVPGGVGPMTIAMLLKNTLEAARNQQRAAAAAKGG